MSVLILAGTAVAVFLLLSVVVGWLGIDTRVLRFAMPIALGVAADLNWLVGRRLNGKPGRELTDAKTGERVVLKPRHDLFWIKMEYWSVPVALLALASLAITIFSAA